MGKHSMPKTHKRAFNKTMAIALAAGVSFGGVQVISAQTGHDVAGQAVAAEAGKLDPSVIKSHSVIANKSGEKITTKKNTFSDVDGKNAFVDKHGDKVNFDVNMEIPDSAKAGESITFKIGGAFEPDMTDGNGNPIKATGNNGETFVIGKWVYNASDKTVTYTLSRDASEYQDRKVHIQFPMRITPLVIDTGDEANKGKAVPKKGTVTLASTGEVLDEFAYEAPYIYKGSKGNIIHYQDDAPLVERDGYFLDDLTPNVNTGEFHGRILKNQIGFADPSNDFNVVENSERPLMWGKYSDETGTHYLDPNSTRDVSVEYTLDNPNFKFAEDNNTGWVFHYPGAEKPIIREEDGKKLAYLFDPDKRKDFRPNEVKGGTFEKETGAKYSVEISDDGQKAVLHYKNVKVVDGLSTHWPLRIKGDFTPGDKFTVNGKFIDGVGTPHEAYHYGYTDNVSFTYTMPESFDDGSGKKIVKKAEMKALVNGKDANDKNSAEQITGGKAKFSIDLKNTGTIGASKAIVKFPKGVTDAKGKTERVVDLSDGSFGPGKTKKIDLGELNVANGAQENKFTVEMNGFKSMSDPAWTNTAKTADSVDPTWGNAEVPDGGTKKIPAGGGAKDAPKGTKYELTGDHPDWITIDSKTGEITAKPPKGTKPGKNQVTVKTTFPDGSTDTDKPVITVTHSDVFIEKVKEVKPDGTVILHRNDGKDISFKVPTGSKVEVNKDGDLVITNPGEKPKTVKLKHTTVTESGKPGTPDHKIIITDENGDTHEFGTYDKFLESVKDDGKGNYTFIMNDGTKLGPIQLGDDIVKVADDGKGNLIVTHKDGSKDTVPLKHTTVKEEGKPGEDGYKITLTTPDGKKVTLDGYDNYVESIEKQKNGDYLVKRNDGTEWTIKLSDIRDDIKKLKGKDAEQDKRLDDLENRVDGIDEEINNLGDRITKNEGAIEDHRKSINDLNQKVGDINNELGDIKDELARLDGQDIKEVRDNGDGTYTLIRNNGDEVTGTIDTSGDIKSITDNGDGTITLTHNDDSTEVVDLTHTKVETKGKPGDKDYTVTITTPDGNKVTLNGSNTYPTKVKDNGDGTYTIILNDGTEVPGKIGDGQDIKELVPNEDGTMTIIHKDGSKSVVDLKQVEITEENKGTPEHTVTITSPNGDSVTFNVFDKYVTNVVKNEDGNYDIFRSDVDGGNTVWKTIVLSDIRGKIADLETRADQLEEKDADLQRQIDELKGRLDNTEKEIESLKDRTDGLEKAVAKINARLSVIELNITALETRMTTLEGRVDTVETTQHAWAQCFSGILGTAIPLLAAAPLVAGSNIQIPGAAEWNNQIQRTLGIYNEQLSRMAGQYQGVAKAAAMVLGVAGAIGLGVHTAKACGPYSKTDAMKDTKAGQLSSKVTAKREGSSREK